MVEAKNTGHMVEAKILGHKRGRHVADLKRYILKAEGVDGKSKAGVVDSRKKAVALVGKKVVWYSAVETPIIGKIIRPHGDKGLLLASFRKGLPGQAIGTKAVIS